MGEACILIVEADILVRHPLAEYLRECGFTVIEASNADEARDLIAKPPLSIDIVLADVTAPEAGGFGLAPWIRANHPTIDVILAGTIAAMLAKAGDLCAEEGPALTKPYDHRLVRDRIRRLIAARERGRPRE